MLFFLAGQFYFLKSVTAYLVSKITNKIDFACTLSLVVRSEGIPPKRKPEVPSHNWQRIVGS